MSDERQRSSSWDSGLGTRVFPGATYIPDYGFSDTLVPLQKISSTCLTSPTSCGGFLLLATADF